MLAKLCLQKFLGVITVSLIFQTQTLEERMHYFRHLALDNPEMLDFLDRNPVGDILHYDEKCIIFSLEGEKDLTLKYVVHPEKYTLISPFYQSVILRGLKNQRFVQEIPGVQKLQHSGFYEGIPGLMGKFVYLPGYNLRHAPKEFSEDADTVLHLFQEIDTSLDAMHAKKILHYDVKPGNIVYSGDRLHLIDFSTAVNFTEDLQDRLHENILGTPGYIYLGDDRSRDYFALGISFAKTLFPDLELGRTNVCRVLDIFSFEFDVRSDLARKFGHRFASYFTELMHRNKEYSSTEEDFFERRIRALPMPPVEERVNYTFRVGNTISLQFPSSDSGYSS
ncbi:MAG TPA: hypothetical protein HA233_05395 [Nanoarchaeota archaeon]|nr:hypothetical protein [Nanoarchaeota archaeon]